jgi:hypothetical protein
MVLMRQTLRIMGLIIMVACTAKKPIEALSNGTTTPIEIQTDAPTEIVEALAPRLKLNAQDPQPALRLEIEARRFSQLQGKTRWRVSGSMELIGPDQTTPLQFEFPVFLDHPHQGEKAALLAAVPHLERRFEQLKNNNRSAGE